MAGLDANALLLLHCDGSDGSTSFPDASSFARTVTAVGNTHVDASTPKFGSACMQFGISGDCATIPDSADFNFGSGNFTIDFWMQPNTPANSRVFTFGRDGGDGSIQLRYLIATPSVDIEIVNDASSVQNSAGITVVNNTYQHIAVVKNGTSIALAVGGTFGTPLTDTGSYSDQTDGWVFGARRNSGGTIDSTWIGRLDEIRISNIARWTANFTPPTLAYSKAGYPKRKAGIPHCALPGRYRVW